MAIHDKNRPERLTRGPAPHGHANPALRECGMGPAPRNGFGAYLLTMAIIGPFNDRRMDRAIRTYRSTRDAAKH